MEETWVDIEDYEKHYQISSFGRVRSLTRVVKRGGLCGNLTKAGQILTPNITPKGYSRIQLQANGLYKHYFIHVLVARAFVDNPDCKTQVNHKDGDKNNNCANNLEWCTPSENLLHAYSNELKKPTVKYFIECPELGLLAVGCESMERQLRRLGYDKARASAVWRCINKGGKHLDLLFKSTALSNGKSF